MSQAVFLLPVGKSWPRILGLQAGKNEPNVLARLVEGEQLFEGWVRIGHEVRSFSPCEQDAEYWIDGKSLALMQISAGYRELMHDAEPYAALFMVVSGYTSTFLSKVLPTTMQQQSLLTNSVGIRPEGVCSESTIKYKAGGLSDTQVMKLHMSLPD